jgi:hypothetical protein
VVDDLEGAVVPLLGIEDHCFGYELAELLE